MPLDLFTLYPSPSRRLFEGEPDTTEVDEPPTPDAQANADAANDSSSEKSFNQSQVNDIVAKEKAKAERSVRAKIAAEQAQAKKDADMTAEEKAKAAEAKAERLESETAAKIQSAERRANIAGQISHPKQLMAVLQADGNADDYFEGDTPNMEKLVADFPHFAVKAESKTPPAGGPNPPSGAAPSTEQEANAALARGDLETYIALTEQPA